MRTARRWIPLLCLAVGVALLAGSYAWPSQAADPKNTPAAEPWEYARMIFTEGQPAVLIEARRRATIQEPKNVLPTTVDRQPPVADRYTAVTKTVHDRVAGALNLAGAAGWEAVDVVLDATTMIVLLKRPARK